MTYTVPFRRTSLQFSQMRLTLDRTFMTPSPGGPVTDYGNFSVYAPRSSRQGVWARFRVRGYHHHFALDERKGVLDMDARQPVAGDNCPVIAKGLGVGPAHVYHRLDRQGQAFFEPEVRLADFLVDKVRNLRVLVHRAAD